MHTHTHTHTHTSFGVDPSYLHILLLPKEGPPSFHYGFTFGSELIPLFKLYKYTSTIHFQNKYRTKFKFKI
jgi:hypothetical protein